EADLDSRLARIDLRALQRLELAKRFVELVLADVKLAETAARPDVLRIDREQALISLNRFFGLAFELVDERQIEQDSVGVRIELQSLAVALFGGQIKLALGPYPAEIIV